MPVPFSPSTISSTASVVLLMPSCEVPSDELSGSSCSFCPVSLEFPSSEPSPDSWPSSVTVSCTSCVESVLPPSSVPSETDESVPSSSGLSPSELPASVSVTPDSPPSISSSAGASGSLLSAGSSLSAPGVRLSLPPPPFQSEFHQSQSD